MSNYTPFTNRRIFPIDDNFAVGAIVHTVLKDSLIAYRGLIASTGTSILAFLPSNTLTDSISVLAEASGGVGTGRCYGTVFLPAGSEIKAISNTITLDGALHIFEID